ncbi:MAG: DUF2178 domain-containing protein [Sedimentisphaerales bacterium]|nr:DUF2178 domain-containing protein [Sedimentisphaerales bacterium]
MDKTQVNDLIGMIFIILFALIMGFAVAVSFYMDGMCITSLFMFAGWLVATGILLLSPFLLQKIRKNKERFTDERHLMIFKDAALAAHSISWIYFLCAGIVAWLIVGPKGSVSVHIIALLFIGWVILYQFALLIICSQMMKIRISKLP